MGKNKLLLNLLGPRIQGVAIAIAIYLSSFLCAVMGHANTLDATASICETAAKNAARLTGVPLDVLQSISLTETGRKAGKHLRPWPWTVNMEGKGVWFDSRTEALDYTHTKFSHGSRSFDVGCFQINFKWHGHNFSSIEEMFDPTKNAVYAAQFLESLFNEKGNWDDAAGAFHSRTPEFADKYRKRFQRIRQSITNQETNIPLRSNTSLKPETQNHFPLLQATGIRSELGSLVPIRSSQPIRFIENR